MATPQEASSMYPGSRKALIALAAAGVIAVPAVAQARGGSDDPPTTSSASIKCATRCAITASTAIAGTIASGTIAGMGATVTTVRTTASGSGRRHRHAGAAALLPFAGSVGRQVLLRPEGGLCAVGHPEL